MQKNIMKIALIAVLLLSCFIQELKSQNLIDPPKLDSTSSTVIDTDFQDFILGWNWGSPGEKLDEWDFAPPHLARGANESDSRERRYSAGKREDSYGLRRRV